MAWTATLTSADGYTARFSTREPAEYPRLHLMDVAGWYGGVGVTGAADQRMGHGLFPEPTERTGRAMTILVQAKYSGVRMRTVLERALSGLLWDGQLATLTVDTGTHELSCQVRLDGEVGIARRGVDTLDVQIPLLAPSPFLHGPERVQQLFPAGTGVGLVWPLFGNGVMDFGDTAAGSMLTIENRGNVKAWPRFLVRGTWPSGFTLTNGRDVVEYRAPVFSQSPAVVDMASGSISVGGNDMTHAATRRGWFGIDPGAVIAPRASSAQQGAGWIDVHTADTYI